MPPNAAIMPVYACFQLSQRSAADTSNASIKPFKDVDDADDYSCVSDTPMVKVPVESDCVIFVWPQQQSKNLYSVAEVSVSFILIISSITQHSKEAYQQGFKNNFDTAIWLHHHCFFYFFTTAIEVASITFTVILCNINDCNSFHSHNSKPCILVV